MSDVVVIALMLFAFCVGVGGTLLAVLLPLYVFYKAWVTYYESLISNLTTTNNIAFQNTCAALQMRVEHKLMSEFHEDGEDDDGEDEENDLPRR